jgi:hypothetical protein
LARSTRPEAGRDLDATAVRRPQRLFARMPTGPTLAGADAQHTEATLERRQLLVDEPRLDLAQHDVEVDVLAEFDVHQQVEVAVAPRLEPPQRRRDPLHVVLRPRQVEVVRIEVGLPQRFWHHAGDEPAGQRSAQQAPQHRHRRESHRRAMLLPVASPVTAALAANGGAPYRPAP